ncbi:MAG: DUF881 domain-containing protein [Clostridiales bacterium]|nr:DUF881 domain-containing protein [Clostridiales bacterium]
MDRKTKQASAAVTCVCILLGFIIGIQVKTVKKQMNTTELQRASDLSTQVKGLQEENERLSNALADSQKKLKGFEDAFAEAGNDQGKALQLILDTLDESRDAAGFTAMKGRGIIVTLDDSKTTADGSEASAFVVHAEDILNVVNELNVAGAEAISINGQRLNARTAIRCSGSVVTVNNVKIAVPFEITAIGDPDVMEAALSFPGGVVDNLTPWGIRVDVKKSSEVIVPAYSAKVEFKEAEPTIQNGGKS